MNQYICTNRNHSFKDEVERLLVANKKEILTFFEVEDSSLFEFNVYIYNTIEELVQGLKDRGFGEHPSYMCACYKDLDNSINLFEPKEEPTENEWSMEEYKKVIFHEEIHAIQSLIYGIQPEWLTEGVAKYLDGTYSRGIAWLLENYIIPQEIPSMDELGYEFGFHDYDSYDYAYLMVSYLIETLGKKKFLVEIRDDKKVAELSHDLVTRAIDYYKDKYQLG